MPSIKNNPGFTLIELLIGVLIIGILVAIVLPQYQKAVERSRATQAITLLRSLYPSVQQYLLIHGEMPTTFDQLDITLDWPAAPAKWYIYHVKDTRAMADWSLQLNDTCIMLGRLSGPYQGSGFTLYVQPRKDLQIATGEITCEERGEKLGTIPFKSTPGAYCQDLLKGTVIPAMDSGRHYRLP